MNKSCVNCNKILCNEQKRNKFCSCRCSAIYNQKDGTRKCPEHQKKILSDLYRGKGFGNAITRTGRWGYKIERIEKKCQSCNKRMYLLPNRAKTKKFCSKKCYNEELKTGYLKGRSGGYRYKSGYGIQGWYKGIFCNSSWELAWVIYNFDHHIKFERNKTGFPYIFKEKTYKFYPDFKLTDESYVEIKGYRNDKTDSKFAQFKNKLLILEKKEITPFLNYVYRKYGRNFTNLYEK